MPSDTNEPAAVQLLPPAKPIRTLSSLWPGTLLAIITSLAGIVQSNTFLFEHPVRGALLDFVLLAQAPLLYFWCSAGYKIRQFLHKETSTDSFSGLLTALEVIMLSPIAPPLAQIFGGGIIGKAIEVCISNPIHRMPPSPLRRALTVIVAVLQMLLIFLSIFLSCGYVLWGNVTFVNRIATFLNTRSAQRINPLMQQIFVAGGMAAPFIWYLGNMGRDGSDSVYFTAQSLGFSVAFLALNELNEKLRAIESGAVLVPSKSKNKTKSKAEKAKQDKPKSKD